MDTSKNGWGDADYKGLHSVGQGEIREETNMKKQFAALLTALSPSADACAGAGILHPAGNQGTGKATDGTKLIPIGMGGKRLWIST